MSSCQRPGSPWEKQHLPLRLFDSRLHLGRADNYTGLLEMGPTSPNAEAHLTQSGTKRLRIRQACRPCHLLKAKCSGSLPACQRCSQKKIPCEYASPKPASRTRKKRMDIAPSEIQQSHLLLSPLRPPEETARGEPFLRELPPHRSRIEGVTSHRETNRDEVNHDQCMELGLEKNIVRLYIDAYFEHIAPLCENGFIHRAIFLRAWTSGKVDPALLKAICSASAAFLPTYLVPEGERERLLAEAEAHIWTNIGRPCMAVLQALVVVISQNYSLSRFSALQPLLGIAAKMAYMLRLNHESTQLSTTAREIRRRVMWSIFILDKRLAAGQSDLISCPIELMHIQLPSNERDFELAIPDRTGILIPTHIDGGDSTSMGTRAYFCRLSHIRHEILR